MFLVLFNELKYLWVEDRTHWMREALIVPLLNRFVAIHDNLLTENGFYSVQGTVLSTSWRAGFF